MSVVRKMILSASKVCVYSEKRIMAQIYNNPDDLTDYLDDEVTSFSHVKTVDGVRSFGIRMSDNMIIFSAEEMKDIIDAYNDLSEEE